MGIIRGNFVQRNEVKISEITYLSLNGNDILYVSTFVCIVYSTLSKTSTHRQFCIIKMKSTLRHEEKKISINRIMKTIFDIRLNFENRLRLRKLISLSFFYVDHKSIISSSFLSDSIPHTHREKNIR